MTGDDLIRKLKDSGTGDAKIAGLLELVGRNASIAEVLDALRSGGESCLATLAKAIDLLPPAESKAATDIRAADVIDSLEKKLAAAVARGDELAAKVDTLKAESKAATEKLAAEAGEKIAALETKLAEATAKKKG